MGIKGKLATFAAGCFWGVEEAFLSSGKVLSTKVGYCGGKTSNPSYKQVCSGTTGHAEVVQLEYDQERTSYGELLDIFWQCHDPTTSNRQGPDVGEQYRSVIFYHDEHQEGLAKESRDERQKHLGAAIVTQIVPASIFYPAEEYHQQYLRKTGGVCHFRP